MTDDELRALRNEVLRLDPFSREVVDAVEGVMAKHGRDWGANNWALTMLVAAAIAESTPEELVRSTVDEMFDTARRMVDVYQRELRGARSRLR
jgi:hypothetical protein